MMQAMKKLKKWSRKKRKKRKSHDFQPPSLTPHHHHHHHDCCCCSSTLPSAPPLPPWLDFHQIPEPISFSSSEIFPVSSSSDPPRLQPQFQNPETLSEITPLFAPSLPVISSTSSSYQQYMNPSPVYGVPIVPETRTKRSAALFGCVGNVGTHLIRCFCPCFRFRDLN